MKKIIALTFTIGSLVFSAKAQLNVSSSTGGVSAGTILAPPSQCSFLSFSNALFTNYPSGSNSAAYIRAGTGLPYSSPTTPDYTFWYDDQTGMYHPSNGNIAFSVWGIPCVDISAPFSDLPNLSSAKGRGWLQIGSGIRPIGNLYAYTLYYWFGSYQYSDSTIKTGISYTLDSNTIKLNLLKPASFYYKTSLLDSIPYKAEKYGTGKKYGFIAQELIHVFPELVTKDSLSGLYSVNYTGIVPLLVKGFQTHDSAINQLDTTVSKLHGVGTCTVPTVLTSANGAINLNNAANFYFEGNGSGTSVNNIAIGKSCTTPVAKLDVLQSSGSTSGSTGMYVANDDIAQSSGTAMAIGLKSYMKNNAIVGSSTNLPSIAGWFEADDSNNSSSASVANYAIYVPSYPPYSGYPVSGGIVSLGFHVPTPSNPFVGEPGGPGYDLQVASSIYAPGFTAPSDRRFKMDIVPLTGALGKIDSINPVYFYYDTTAFPQNQFSSRQQVGFIAQNVDSVLPQVISMGNGYYGLDYSRMTSLLLAGEKELIQKADSLPMLEAALKQQQNHIDSLTNTLDSLRSVFKSYISCLNSLCGGTGEDGGHVPIHHNGRGNVNSGDTNSTTTNVQDVTLSALSDAPLLYQNIPNPFSAGTKINYYLPTGTMGATIVFYDTYGNQLKQVQLNQTGNGTLNITPDNLTNGIYSYSLIVNGAVIDTKRMILQK